MTLIYALKDPITNCYLAKDDRLHPIITTTTRTFQKRDKALEVAKNINTYFSMAVEIKYKQTKQRVNVIDPDFKHFYYEWKQNRPLQVVPVIIEEFKELINDKGTNNDN